jgi:transglutaminase-like putative cysteine protease
MHDNPWAYGALSPGYGPLSLLESKRGTCKEQTEFMTYILRSLGIPAYIDIIVQNANSHYQAHYWNYSGLPAKVASMWISTMCAMDWKTLTETGVTVKYTGRITNRSPHPCP